MLPIYFLHVSILIWKELQRLSNLPQPRIAGGLWPRNPSSVFNVASHRLRERLGYCGTQRLRVCSEAEPHCDTKMCACVCLSAYDWARPKQITQTKEESRRHQMNGLFLFLLYKRQTDGPTELQARWIYWSF